MITTNINRLTGVRLLKRKGLDLFGPMQADARVSDHGVSYEFIAAYYGWPWEPQGDGREFEQCVGTNIYIYCHQAVNNGVQSWYAFPTYDDRDLFLKLIAIDKIGPSSAMKIIGKNTGSLILDLLAAGDRDAFLKLPGLGGKQGTRIADILFKDKPPLPDRLRHVPLDENAVAGLRALGYDAKPSKEAVTQAQIQLPQGSTTSTIVVQALKLLNTNQPI